MSSGAPLQDLVKDWLALDPVRTCILHAESIIHFLKNPETRDEIKSLWDRHEFDELEKRLRYDLYLDVFARDGNQQQ